ncbi:MAG: hypothetical protein HZB53_04490 [Chloroflexi bacterium]|nr:hypothetical protein [Chloroflexota bacterium]
MSSFANPHHIYLFNMTNGRQKLAYGASPEDALAILQMRLTEREMALIIKDQCERVNQRELRKFILNLG